MTNGDRIRTMTDEELVDNFYMADNPDIRMYPMRFCLDTNDDCQKDSACYGDCRECFINYLKEEATE